LQPVVALELIVVPRREWSNTLRASSVTELQELAAAKSIFNKRALEQAMLGRAASKLILGSGLSSRSHLVPQHSRASLSVSARVNAVMGASLSVGEIGSPVRSPPKPLKFVTSAPPSLYAPSVSPRAYDASADGAISSRSPPRSDVGGAPRRTYEDATAAGPESTPLLLPAVGHGTALMGQSYRPKRLGGANGALPNLSAAKLSNGAAGGAVSQAKGASALGHTPPIQLSHSSNVGRRPLHAGA